MASITIRKLDPDTKQRLRIQAARNGRSMEEEARDVLRRGVGPAGTAKRETMWSIAREIFGPIGGVELELPPRGPRRALPKFDE